MIRNGAKFKHNPCTTVARDTKTTQTEITPPDFFEKETQVDYSEIKEMSTQTEDVENEPEEEGVLGFLCRNLPEEECSIDNLPARLRKHFEQSPQSIEVKLTEIIWSLGYLRS